MKTYCLMLDLHDDPALIEEYKQFHRPEKIWPEVVDNILAHGVMSEEIHLAGNRMVMILRTTEEFSFAAKARSDQTNPRMKEWEELMWKFQKPVPGAKPGEKWLLMEKIFAVGDRT